MFQAFFLEDALVQTRYLEEIGVATAGDDRIGGEGIGGPFLLNGGGGGGADGLGKDGTDSYDCALCGKSGFRYVSASVLVVLASFVFGDGFVVTLVSRVRASLRFSPIRRLLRFAPSLTNVLFF